MITASGYCRNSRNITYCISNTKSYSIVLNILKNCFLTKTIKCIIWINLSYSLIRSNRYCLIWINIWIININSWIKIFNVLFKPYSTLSIILSLCCKLICSWSNISNYTCKIIDTILLSSCIFLNCFNILNSIWCIILISR